MKIKAVHEFKVVYIIGFCPVGLAEKAIISCPRTNSKAMIKAVDLSDVCIIDDEYNPFYEELQNG